jgi:ATP-dependent exoDNAse (exonuclease V) alpha subunit
MKQHILGLSMKKTENMPGILQLTNNIPVMLTWNKSVALGLTNGTTGILRQIIYGPADYHPSPANHQIFKTAALPLALVVEFPDRNLQLKDLPANWVPIFPRESKFNYRFSARSGLQRSIAVNRKQFPLTANFAFTNYKCQGDTLSSAIVDLVDDGSTTTDASAAYVSLSRVTNSKSLYILRHFPIKLIQRQLKDWLKKGMERLMILEKRTMEKLDQSPSP